MSWLISTLSGLIVLGGWLYKRQVRKNGELKRQVTVLELQVEASKKNAENALALAEKYRDMARKSAHGQYAFIELPDGEKPTPSNTH